MRATGKAFHAAILAFALSSFSAAAAYCQAAPSANPQPRRVSVSLGAERSNCADSSYGSVSGLARFQRFGENTPFTDRLADRDSSAPSGECIAAPPITDTRVTRPCLDVPRSTASSLDNPLCASPELPAAKPLSALGKEGVKISEAREQVLAILSTQNACSEWFESKDPFPGQTFRSLNFQVDRRGQNEVFEFPQSSGTVTLRHPYVAWATQDGGPFSTITLNAYGAFYRPQGRVEKMNNEGGPLRLDGMRTLTVGPYEGSTLAAQIVTLLHELGHVIDLLPHDGDDVEGSSIHNTNEVLRHCQPEVDARVLEAKASKSRRF